MGYKFEVKQTGDSIVREFSEPVDSSLGTKWPCKKNVIIFIVFVVIICLSIGIGVGIHIMEKNMKEKSSQSDTTSPTTNTGLPTPKICPWFQDESPLVLISIGGYRADYLSRDFTPTIHTLSRLGVTAPYMMSVNPTLTQPNLYTIVTGLYPESHGIVHDTFTDPKTKKKFNINHPDSLKEKQWWKGEPIWVTLGRQNKTAAAIGWPGTDVNLSDLKPTVFKMNASQNTLLEPIQQIFNWLEKSSNQRPNLILWYIDYAVKAMQKFGPNSPLVWDKLAEIDGAIHNLWTGLKRKSLDNCVNLVIVSDHGMSSTSSERIFNFQPYVSSQKWSVNGYAFTVVQARNNVSANDIEDLATKVECQSQNVKVFTKSSVPKRYHVFNNPMVGDAFLQANDQWISSRSKSTKDLGSSGYDNRHKNMRALFLAVGPGFRDNFLIEPFENIELYNMMSELMKLKPSKNNGTTGSLNHIINSDKPLLTKSKAPKSCTNTENWKLIQKYLYERPCYNKTSIDSLLIPKLKDSVRKKATILKKNLPMGPPIDASSNSCYVLLYQTDFVVGASNDRLMPLWISTTLDIQSKWTETLTGSLQKKRKNCVFTDARMDVKYWTKGIQQNQDIGFLYNIDFLDAPDAYLSSNAVRMFTGFRNGIWKFLWQTLKKYSRSESVNVVVGPVFDKNHDGIFDPADRSNSSELPVPSHFFIVLSKCREKKATNFTECLIEDKLEILSFVLPHRQKIDNCMNYADFLQEHIVRIRDIELLTGLHFFKAYQHHSAVVRQRVYMPASLWPSFDTEKWLKQPCFYTRKSSCPREPAVLLISLSGFGPSHFALSRTPVLDKIRTCGIRSTHMRPVYPSNKIPSMYSIVTGVFPESHGLLSKYINKGENQTTWEPIWVTAEKQNKSTAVYGWPGLKYSIDGSKYPKWIPDGSKFGFKKRIQMILDWLSLSGNERVDFIGAHFEEPDLSAHKYGANNHRVENALTSIDAFMGQLMDGMKERNLEKCVNLIIVSDHGIQETSYRRVVDKVDLKNSFIIEGATVFQKSDHENATVNEMLKNNSCTRTHFRTYTKATLPQRFHFTNNGQIGDVILTLDDGWLIKQKYKLPKSTHGYDNRFDSMQSIFLASGPSFQFNMTIEPFENIELYNLLTELLSIQPLPNNGTKGTLNKLLMNRSSVQQISPTNYTSCCSVNSNIGTDCAYSVSPQNDLLKQVPFGVPNFHKTGNFCILHTDAFSLAKSNDIQMPLWFAYNLPKENSSNLSNYGPISCMENANHNVTTGSLFFSGEQYDNGSSKVPMYKEFKEGVWKELGNLVREYTVKYTSLNVISGPIFKDGLDNAKRLHSVNCSVPIPTHFYVILSKLSSADMSIPAEVLPIILPHVEKDQNCLKPKDYFFDHTARIRDIELLTGLTFMTDIPWEKSIKIRTYLPLEMWESLRPSSWMKLQHCVNLDKACKNASRPVLLISLDGFRADYTNYEVTPVINRLRECGIQTSFMRSSFPSKTFPNHYTIATGLYPESHGIVGNYMYDMEKNDVFKMSTTDPYWWGGETIWKTLSKAGKESGSYFFVGSSISGVNATYFYPYSGKTSYEDRIDQAVAWIRQGLPFVSIYFEEPDSTGHREGPSSKQILNTLRLVDSYIGQLMNKLYEENMHNCVNIIIVADHGMTDVNCERSVVLWDIIDKETATKDMFVYSDGRVTNKYWQEGKTFKRFSNGSYAITVPELTSKLECSSRHMKVFQKEFLPKRLHYTKHKRIGDIQLLINDTWYLQRKNLYCGGRGSHGYDNRFKSMNALFLAYGPDFKQQLHTEPFQNIEIYNLFTDLLNIPGAPNNGTEGRLHRLLRRPPPETLRQSVGQYKNVSFNMNFDDLALFLKKHRCLNFTPTNKEVSLIYTSMVNSNKKFQEISFGLPLLKNNVSIQMLKHKAYLTAYDTNRKRLLFIAATRKSSQPFANFSDAGNGCIVDPRVHFDQMKYDQTENNYTWLNLTPADFADDEEKITSFLSTNFIRVAKAFKEDLWIEALNVVQKWRTSFSMFTWFVGPIYDYNLDGLADDDDTIKRFTNESLPTNVFFVLVGCQNTGEIEATTAYILPSNQQHFPKCRKMSQMLRDHQARVRDVELLTNLEFYPKEPFQKAVIHRTSMIDVKLPLKD